MKCYIFETCKELQSFVNKKMNKEMFSVNDHTTYPKDKTYFVSFVDDKISWCYVPNGHCPRCQYSCEYYDDSYSKIHMGRKQKLERLLK